MLRAQSRCSVRITVITAITANANSRKLMIWAFNKLCGVQKHIRNSIGSISALGGEGFFAFLLRVFDLFDLFGVLDPVQIPYKLVYPALATGVNGMW